MGDRDAPGQGESTVDLVVRAKSGDAAATDALLERLLPLLKRWAHGHLPAPARSMLDTADLVQDAAINMLRRLHAFEPRHAGALRAYMHLTVANRIRDEVRQVARRPPPADLPEEAPADQTSPFEAAARGERYARYRRALEALTGRDRELIVARIERHSSFAEIATRFGIPSADAARMAVSRALRRLADELHAPDPGRNGKGHAK